MHQDQADQVGSLRLAGMNFLIRGGNPLRYAQHHGCQRLTSERMKVSTIPRHPLELSYAVIEDLAPAVS